MVVLHSSEPDHCEFTPGSCTHLVCVCVCLPAMWLQLCLILCDPLDYSPRGSSVHGILPGVGVKTSTRGKGHEEGSTYAKAGSSLRSPPGNSQASIPKTRVCLLYYFVLSPIPLIYGGLSPNTSFGERVNLELQLIIIPGHDRSVPNLQTPLKFLSCLTGLSGHM